jgi:hypothetical protein
LFVLQSELVSLDLAAAVLLSENTTDKTVSKEADVLPRCQQCNPDGQSEAAGVKSGQLKTKVRRLYDIANILTSLGLICKVGSCDRSIRKLAFKYTGPNIEAALFSDQGKSKILPSLHPLTSVVARTHS